VVLKYSRFSATSRVRITRCTSPPAANWLCGLNASIPFNTNTSRTIPITWVSHQNLQIRTAFCALQKARTAKTTRGSLYQWKYLFVDFDCSQGFGTFHLGTSTIAGSGWEENGKTRGSNRCEELLEKLLE
jgi:hypothetical protein